MTSRKFFASLFVIVVTAVVWTASLQAQGDARVRLIHVASTVPAVDIYVNGELAVPELSYGESSATFSLPAGAAELKATVGGMNTQLFIQRLSLEHDASAIVLSSSAEAPLSVVPDDLTPA